MIKNLLTICLVVLTTVGYSQTHPAITSWLQNTTVTGTYYVENNSTALDNNILVNTQQVCFTNDNVYITATGVPAYATGPFFGNPSQASDQNAVYKFPLNPQEETGTKSETTAGNIGVFINGVSLFDYRDGVAWNTNTNALCGGPGNSPCPGGPMASNDWNRDAIPAEMAGFDCSKAHPAMGNYHHHQNPSAFKLDLTVLSNICNLYDADGLYVIDASTHSPLIGFAYDGFPIYGAYGYANADGTGGVTRIKSGYQLRNITTRTVATDGTNVDDGPAVSTTYFLGYFREDYEWVANTSEEYLDEHNGRFCITPEYPNGTYAYFATVDANWNSAYPYVVGPTFYGEYENRSVSSIDESTTIYETTTLPIETLSFDAQQEKDFVLVSWVTALEINNDYFLLQRSTDGRSFETIAKIKGGENKATSSIYQYEDNDDLAGTVYYRLQQFDFDENFSVSEMVVVKLASRKKDIVSVFPNPASDLISVQSNGLVTQDITVGLYNINGKLVESKTILPGSTISYFDCQILYDGEYFIHINDGKNIQVKKIIIKHD